MKRKIGELRNIPIVEGDKNLVREGTEIHINDLQSNDSSNGSSIKYVPKYYRFKEDTPDEYTQMAVYGSTVKINRNGDISIECTFEIVGSSIIKALEFSFNPLYTVPDETKMYIDSFEELADNGGFSEIKQYIERITEEEYYKIN